MFQNIQKMKSPEIYQMVGFCMPITKHQPANQMYHSKGRKKYYLNLLRLFKLVKYEKIYDYFLLNYQNYAILL